MAKVRCQRGRRQRQVQQGKLTHIIPEHGGVLEVGLRVSLLGVDEVGKLCWVAQEEDGRVVEDPVEVALLGPHLDRKATGVTGRVGRARLATDGGEAEGEGRLFALLEKLGAREIRDVVRGLKDTVGTAALGVDDALGDALPVKVGEQVDVVEVLEQERSTDGLVAALDALRLVGLRVRCTVGRRVGDGLGTRAEDFRRWHCDGLSWWKRRLVVCERGKARVAWVSPYNAGDPHSASRHRPSSLRWRPSVAGRPIRLKRMARREKL